MYYMSFSSEVTDISHTKKRKTPEFLYLDLKIKLFDQAFWAHMRLFLERVPSSEKNEMKIYCSIN